jgi:hypothetical protein
VYTYIWEMEGIELTRKPFNTAIHNTLKSVPTFP